MNQRSHDGGVPLWPSLGSFPTTSALPTSIYTEALHSSGFRITLFSSVQKLYWCLSTADLVKEKYVFRPDGREVLLILTFKMLRQWLASLPWIRLSDGLGSFALSLSTWLNSTRVWLDFLCRHQRQYVAAVLHANAPRWDYFWWRTTYRKEWNFYLPKKSGKG